MSDKRCPSRGEIGVVLVSVALFMPGCRGCRQAAPPQTSAEVAQRAAERSDARASAIVEGRCRQRYARLVSRRFPLRPGQWNKENESSRRGGLPRSRQSRFHRGGDCASDRCGTTSRPGRIFG